MLKKEKMKAILIILMICAASIMTAQSLPKAVEKAFHAQFPNTEISSWKNNNSYKPLTTDVLYPTDDMNGATAIETSHVPDDTKELGLKDPLAATEYYIFFTKDNTNWTATFRTDGMFIVAHAKVDALPEKVSEAIANSFKGQTIKIVDDIQKVIVPSSETPIYRVYVKPKKGKKHIVKVNTDGTVLSNKKK